MIEMPAHSRIVRMKYSFLLLCCLLFVTISKAQDTDIGVAQGKLTSETMAAAEHATRGCPPGGKAITAGINKNGVYMLKGDLFGDGQLSAIVERRDEEGLTQGLFICRWDGKRWQLISSIDAQIFWKYPGWSEEKTGKREPASTRPFWMLDLQGRKLLAVALYEEKAGQNYCVILLKSGKILDTISSFSCAPVVQFNYLITADASRVKSTNSDYFVSRISKDKFTGVAEWHEYEPYNNTDSDDGYEQLVFDGRTYDIKLEASTGKDASDRWTISLIVQAANGSESASPPYAEISFSLKPGAKQDPDNTREVGYIFEKITGLKRGLFYSFYGQDAGEPSTVSTKPIESETKIQVTGSEDAVKRLSPGLFH